MEKKDIYEKTNFNFIITFIFVIVCGLQTDVTRITKKKWMGFQPLR